jgi:hypothetical protein
MKLVLLTVLGAAWGSVLGAAWDNEQTLRESGASWGSEQTLRESAERIINSRVLPGNLLPNFMTSQQRVETGPTIRLGSGRGVPATSIPDDSCGDDIFADLNDDLRSPQLPNLSQDLWTCDRIEEDISSYVYENSEVRVTINPQYGGRVSSIFDKNGNRENLFHNPAHQPALIGALKAWTSGGMEFNWSPGIIGHSAFTESTVYMSKVESSRGLVIRLHEFDRLNGTVWQADLLLDNSTLFVHPKITNPTDVDLRGYWWTCVAVPSTAGTRIITPATHVAETSRLVVGDAPWPVFAEAIENSTFGAQERDNSYLGSHPSSGDFFLRVPSTSRPFIGHVADNDGYFFVHGHPLNGTKFFTWGNSGPGRFFQDFLAGGRERQGDYTELQVGVAPTQLQTFPLPRKSSRGWTEYFKSSGDFLSAQEMHSPDYSAVIKTVKQWMDSPDGVPAQVVAERDAFFEQLADQPVSSIVVTGSPWGAVEELLLGRPLAPGLSFTLPTDPSQPGYDEALPWIELVKAGDFSEQTLDHLPLSYQTTDRWLAVLLESPPDGKPMSWLRNLHLGVCFMERGDGAKAKSYFETSMALRPNPIAARNLALLSSSSTDAMLGYRQAWDILASPSSPWRKDRAFQRLVLNLVNEMGVFLAPSTHFDDMAWLLSIAPEETRSLDSVLRVEVVLALHNREYDKAMQVLESNCWPTYATDRQYLMTLWTQAVEAKAGAVTQLDRHRARMESPIPRNIGCNKGSKYCINYWRR